MPTFCLTPRPPDLARPKERTILRNQLHPGVQTHPKDMILSGWGERVLPQASSTGAHGLVWRQQLEKGEKQALRNFSVPQRNFLFGPVREKKNPQCFISSVRGHFALYSGEDFRMVLLTICEGRGLAHIHLNNEVSGLPPEPQIN